VVLDPRTIREEFKKSGTVLSPTSWGIDLKSPYNWMDKRWHYDYADKYWYYNRKYSSIRLNQCLIPPCLGYLPRKKALFFINPARSKRSEKGWLKFTYHQWNPSLWFYARRQCFILCVAKKHGPKVLARLKKGGMCWDHRYQWWVKRKNKNSGWRACRDAIKK
jgi:hypothetical protein